MTLRIGSVPYLNGKPLVDWFHSDECDADVQITYAVPSRLAQMLRNDLLDVAMVSIFEALQNPDMLLVPGISISAMGAVKSVRLFSRTELDRIQSVALDTSSLTSTALTQILLSEAFHISPEYRHCAPNLDAMLTDCDAGLIIGDLKLFDLLPGTRIYDLGQGWYDLVRLPFVYAGWLARRDRASREMTQVLDAAKRWGIARREALAVRWAGKMDLPIDRSLDYLTRIMDYDLGPTHLEGLRCYQEKCHRHELLPHLHALQFVE